jgi:hypothetical protein
MSNDKGRQPLSQLLRQGPVDKLLLASVELMEELQAAAARNDSKAMLEIGRKLKANAAERQSAKAGELAAVTAAFDDATATADPDERTTKLVDAFALAAKTMYRASDAYGDTEARGTVTMQAHAIAAALDAIPPGRRAALATLLDNADPGVRVMAAVLLKDVMPERAIPVLKQIHEEEAGTSPGFTALFALPP